VKKSSTASDAWRFQQPTAELGCGALSGRVDVSQPQLGLHDISIESRALIGRILCVGQSEEAANGGRSNDRTWPVAEAYVRGADLVATYKPTDNWPFFRTVSVTVTTGFRADSPARDLAAYQH
jgi:hypothetical protein